MPSRLMRSVWRLKMWTRCRRPRCECRRRGSPRERTCRLSVRQRRHRSIRRGVWRCGHGQRSGGARDRQHGPCCPASIHGLGFRGSARARQCLVGFARAYHSSIVNSGWCSAVRTRDCRTHEQSEEFIFPPPAALAGELGRGVGCERPRRPALHVRREGVQVGLVAWRDLQDRRPTSTNPGPQPVSAP